MSEQPTPQPTWRWDTTGSTARLLGPDGEVWGEVEKKHDGSADGFVRYDGELLYDSTRREGDAYAIVRDRAEHEYKRVRALTVACPVCQAQPGQPCTRYPGGQGYDEYTHDGREPAARQPEVAEAAQYLRGYLAGYPEATKHLETILSALPTEES